MVRLFISIALLLPLATVGAATVEDLMIDHAMSALVFVAAGFDALATTNDSTGGSWIVKEFGPHDEARNSHPRTESLRGVL
jgi:hypothetical protein